jgi:hypothetical protein
VTNITVCLYHQDHRFVIAICHNTKANIVKAKLFSTKLVSISPSSIQVIKNSAAIDLHENPDQIIRQCFAEAAAIDLYSNLYNNEILEVVYFGDVNLLKPGLKEYPALLKNKEAFAQMIKTYFPACILIKRILVSADTAIIGYAQQKFANVMSPQNKKISAI